MSYKLFFHITLFIIELSLIKGEHCYTAQKGNHYSTFPPFGGIVGFKFHDSERTERIKFNSNTAEYVFKPTDIQGARCGPSWMKLYGFTRCASFVHQNSDRFVWRRAQSCLTYSGEF